jgi:Asp-tRNA(Asn)/Glu-tRNA(Gln) amidotransferase C subunit
MTLSELKQKYKPMTLFELAKLDITEAERKDYERKLDYIARMENQLKTAKEEGIKIGEEKGVPINIISKIIGLSED